MFFLCYLGMLTQIVQIMNSERGNPMTLLVVDKKEKVIHVGSDSRYSLGEYRLDCGPKVFEVKARFSYATDSQKSSKVGFAFDGDVTFFFSLKSKLDLVFDNLFVYPYQNSEDEIMMEKVEDICNEIANDYLNSRSADGQYSLLNCIGTQVLFFYRSIDDGKTLKAYCFTCGEDYKFTCDEIPDGETFYGSGAEKALLFYDAGEYKNIVRFLLRVIKDAGEDTIGGSVQLGRLDENEFNIIGYQDFDGFKYVYHLGNAVVDTENFIPREAAFYKIWSEDEIKEKQENYVSEMNAET